MADTPLEKAKRGMSGQATHGRTAAAEAKALGVASSPKANPSARSQRAAKPKVKKSVKRTVRDDFWSK